MSNLVSDQTCGLLTVSKISNCDYVCFDFLLLKDLRDFDRADVD